MHVALGWEYRSHRVSKGSVVYVACEGERGLGSRIAAFKLKHALNAEDPPFYLITTRLDLVTDHHVLIADIRAQIGQAQPSAIAIDTLNRSIRGSESSDEDMSAYIKAADAIREAFSCAVIVIHHCGIDDKRPRGHTSLTGAADAQLAVRRGANGTMTLTVEWMKDGADGETFTSCLEVVEVGADEDGEAITSCVIAPTDDAPPGKRASIGGQASVALDLLRKALASDGQPAPAGRHFPGRTTSVVPLELWRRYCKSGGLAGVDNDEAFKKAFQRSRQKLTNARIISVWEGLVWIASPMEDKET
jgi:AAA domain